MGCARGNARPDKATELRLFAQAAGRCQNPECLVQLFDEAKGIRIKLAEMAHILPASPGGPRRTPTAVPPEQLRSESNFLLLCPTCHSRVDKAPIAYPSELLQGWKSDFKARLVAAFDIVRRETRTAARADVVPLLRENDAIFRQCGPLGDHTADPESEIAQKWSRKVLAKILPNNRRLLLIFQVNSHLLQESEQAEVETFRQHVDDLEHRHLGGECGGGVLFPSALDGIFL
jgi:hypothetical protein